MAGRVHPDFLPEERARQMMVEALALLDTLQQGMMRLAAVRLCEAIEVLDRVLAERRS